MIAVGLIDGAQRHALVGGADHHGDAERGEALLDRLADLRRERFLHLQPAGEDVDHARQLRQADDAAVGQIGDVGDAGEGRDVVLAMAFEAHVAQQDHVAIAGDVLEGAGELGGGILAVAAEPLLVGLDDALGRIGEPRARRIVAGPGEQRAHGVLGLGAGGLGRRRRFCQLDARAFLHGALLSHGGIRGYTASGPCGMCGAAGCPILSVPAGPKGRPAAPDELGDTWPI